MRELYDLLINRLTSDAALVAAVGNRIGYRRGEAKTFPTVVIDFITNPVSDITMSCIEYKTIVQFTVFVENFYPGTAWDIMELVKRNVSYEAGKIHLQDANIRVDRIFPGSESETRLQKTDINGSGLWQVTSDYRFEYTKL